MQPGARVGPYQVSALIGMGGMGEVYRAHDTQLRRDVAIKVLPRAVCTDPERVARFEREARVLAALNHPHVASIHGLEHVDGSTALVLELVEGPTLADRIAAGPLPVTDALAIATQIAEALAAAHEKGIIHRDLKPANIKVGVENNVKVLDFGLARMIADESAAEQGGSPTATNNYTHHGQVLGTAAYMSPEQARGHATDRRTDVWAFACVLFEMLVGRSAFAQPTTSDTIVSVLDREPDWNALPPTTPEHIRLLLRQCLEKDVRRRRREMADIALDLQRPRGTLSGIELPADAQPRTGRRTARVLRYTLVAALGAVTVTALWAWSLWRADNVVPGDVAEFTVYPPPGTTFPLEAGAPWPSISPDGRQLAFVALTSQGTAQLWARPIGSAAGKALAGTEGAARPFWSPDSRALGFFADGKIKRIDLADGNVHIVCDAPYLGGMSATWGAADVILFTHVGGLFRVSAAGGRPVLALPDASTPDDRNQRQNPSFLPDGRRFVFVTQRSKPDDSEVCIGSLDSLDSRCVVKVPSPARYAPPGYLLFGRDGVLRLQRFDADRVALAGEALPLSSQHVRVTPVFRPPPFSIAANALAFHSGMPATSIVWRDRTGAVVSRLPMLGDGDYGAWSTSSDGRFAATSALDARTDNTDIWLYDEQRAAWAHFTFDAGPDTAPRFSPDGSRIVFASTRGGVPGLYVKPTNAAGSEQLLATVGYEAAPQDWSSDGRLILYGVFSSKTSWDVGVVSTDGRTPATLIISSEHGERGPRFSPNRKWIAYDSTESGRREVWIQPYPPTGDRWQVSMNGGVSPLWRGDGEELFYIRSDGMLTAVPIAEGAAPAIGTATPLFQTLLREGGTTYAVAADGRRFLMGVPPSGLDATPITVRLNWRAAIEHR